MKPTPDIMMPRGSNLSETVGRTGSTTWQSVTGTTAHTKGNYQQITAATTYRWAGFYVFAAPFNGMRAALMDIAIGPGGSEEIIVANMPIASAQTDFRGGNINGVFVPLEIPKGTEIRCRIQHETTASESALVALRGLAPAPNVRVYSRATTYGADTSDTGGTKVSSGAMNRERGAWVEVVSNSNPIRHLLLMMAGQLVTWGAATDAVPVSCDIAVGPAYRQRIIATDLNWNALLNPDSHTPSSLAIPDLNIPRGSSIWVRCSKPDAETDATGRNLDFIMIGFD